MSPYLEVPTPRAWCASFNFPYFCVCFAAFLISSELKFGSNKTRSQLCPEFGINTWYRYRFGLAESSLPNVLVFMNRLWLGLNFILFSREKAQNCTLKTSWQFENKSIFRNFMLFWKQLNLILKTFHGGTLVCIREKQVSASWKFSTAKQFHSKYACRGWACSDLQWQQNETCKTLCSKKE